MSIIQSMADASAKASYIMQDRPREVVGHLGFTLAVRREMLPLLQVVATAPPVAANIMGLRILESEHIPPGHYMINGVLYRYTKPTLDEMCTEAKARMSEALDISVRSELRSMHTGFNHARSRLAILYAITDFWLETIHTTPLSFWRRGA